MFPGQTARVIDGNRNVQVLGTTRYSRNYSVPGFPRFLSVHMFGFPLRVFATVRANGFPQKWHPRFVFRTAVPIRGSNSNATPERDIRKVFHGHLEQPIKVTQRLFFKEPCAVSLRHVLCDNKDGFLGHHMQSRLWSSTLTFRHPVTNFRIREFKYLSTTDEISSTVIFETRILGTMRPILEHQFFSGLSL